MAFSTELGGGGILFKLSPFPPNYCRTIFAILGNKRFRRRRRRGGGVMIFRKIENSVGRGFHVEFLLTYHADFLFISCVMF